MLFRKKQNNLNQPQPQKKERGINYIFKIIGLLAIIYAVYQSYFGNNGKNNIGRDIAEISSQHHNNQSLDSVKKNQQSDKSENQISGKTDNSNNKECITEEMIQKKAEEAFNIMSEKPEFKKIQDFVRYVDSNKPKNEAGILDSKDGYIIYVPHAIITNERKEPLKIKNKNIEFNISEKILDKNLTQNATETENLISEKEESIKKAKN